MVREQLEARERPLPRFCAREIDTFLRCGVLAYGFARVWCQACGKDDVVAFSCKGRGFCPSCGARRMADTAAWLVDRVIPEQAPVRQWVLSLPYRLRVLCAYDPDACALVRRVLVRAVSGFYEGRARPRQPQPPRIARTLLPDEIIDRKKVGFRVPLDEWFRGGLKDFVHDLLLGRDAFVSRYLDRAAIERMLQDHMRSRRNEELRLWTLMGFEVWHREFLRGA
jgi:hypothetical protein